MLLLPFSKSTKFRMVSFNSLPTILPSPIVPGPPKKTNIRDGSFLAMHSNIAIAVFIANPTEFASRCSGILCQLSRWRSSKKEFIEKDTSPTGIMNFGRLDSFTRIELVKFLLFKSVVFLTVNPSSSLISSISYFFSPFRA